MISFGRVFFSSLVGGRMMMMTLYSSSHGDFRGR